MQTGERQACRLRSKYVQALLYQEIGFFDTSMSVGEVVSSISTDTLMFQEAIGEKVRQDFVSIQLCLQRFIDQDFKLSKGCRMFR